MKSFSCPQCGASLKSGQVSSTTVECPYCHSAVIVPPELRPPPPPEPPPVFSSYEPDLTPPQSFSFPTAIALLVGGVFLVIVLIVMLAGPRASPPSSTYPPPMQSPTFSARTTATPNVLTFGGEGTGPGLFQDAHEVAVDGTGNVYVSDDTFRIQKFDASGNFVSLWTIPSDTKYLFKPRSGPERLLASRDGKVYVVIGGVVLKYDGTNGESLGVVSGSDFIHDASLKADGGIVLVSANGNDDELVVLDAKGKATKRIHRFISSQLDKPVPVTAVKVAVDGVGNIFGMYALGSIYGEHYYDYSDLAVFRFTADGKYVNRFGGGGKEPGQFSLPNAISTDSQSRVYVCDTTVGIHVFSSDGRFLETIKTPFWVEGMAFDTAGDLFVVGANKVSRLVLAK